MKNPRITPRERGLLKGALRRVFARSDLRNKVLMAAVVAHSDPKRQRVKTWCKCAVCGRPEAKSNIVVDHIQPVIAVNSSFEEQGLDETANRLWCTENNLQPICESCHNEKSSKEAAERRKNKKGKRK